MNDSRIERQLPEGVEIIKPSFFDKKLEKKFGPLMGTYLYLRCKECGTINLPKDMRDSGGGCRKCGAAYYIPVKHMSILEEVELILRLVW